MKREFILFAALYLAALVAFGMLIIIGAHIVKWLVDTRLVFIAAPLALLAIAFYDTHKKDGAIFARKCLDKAEKINHSNMEEAA